MIMRYKQNLLKTPLWINSIYNPFADRLPFFVTQIGEFCCGKGHFAEGMEHPDYIMIYTVSGNAQIKYRDKEYTLSSGTLVIFNCMEYHLYKNVSDTPWLFRRITFDGASAGIFENLINDTELKIIEFDEKCFYDMFENVVGHINENSTNSVIKVSLEILSLLSKCIENSKNSSLGLTNDINDIMKYINSRYSKRITLEELSHIANISKYHLIKRFKKQVGVTPYEYILKLRITKAKHLLRNTEKSIRQISEDVGISDVSSFIKQFKRHTAITPSKYRTENKNYL